MSDERRIDKQAEDFWEPKLPTVPTTWLLADFCAAFEPVSVNQRKLPAKAYKASGLLPVVDQGQSFIGGYTDDASLAIDPGDGVIVFGDHTKTFKRVDFPFVAGADGIKVLRPRLSNSRYAFYVCLSLQLPDRGYSRHYSFLTRCRVPIAPIKEQERIVSKIDELFSRIEDGERALERVQKLVERYRQSILKAAVSGELTRDWREKNKGKLETGEALLARILNSRRAAWEKTELAKMQAKGNNPANDNWKLGYEEPASPDTTDFPELPEGWVWASFRQLGEFGRGKSKHRPRNDPKLYGGEFPFLQTGTVRASNGRITTYDTTYNDMGLAQSKLWPKGTICITIAANIAESGLLEFEACFPDSVVGLVPDVNVVGEYIEFFIRTERASLDRYAPATAQKNINLEILERVAVPLPPLEEQREIYSKAQEELSKIDDIERTLATGATHSASLRQSILKSAFSGSLVSHNQIDESVSLQQSSISAKRANEIPTMSKPKYKQKTKPLE